MVVSAGFCCLESKRLEVNFRTFQIFNASCTWFCCMLAFGILGMKGAVYEITFAPQKGRGEHRFRKVQLLRPP